MSYKLESRKNVRISSGFTEFKGSDCVLKAAGHGKQSDQRCLPIIE